MREKLEAKLQKFQELRQAIAVEQFDIEAKVEEYRAALMRELEKGRAKKLEKVDTYIELLESLIAEMAEEEAPIEEPAMEEAPAEVAPEMPEQPIEEIKEEEV